ncbi:restriction endonuclease [Carnobacterium divergens]|uniref:Eco57I restriction-modification methylase domain-containing protein n=1 Tax=Carnobacterium divergens TaxID=2748 RepID=UPI000E72F9F0|nr:Eco57I restriction-modification methylase domain-containing protein [Carnobacterium divergens]AOA00528.1 restriction endonuclease [Carnobacterium divergens]
MNDSFLNENIDIDENAILRYSPELLKILLRDRTTGKNIIWATKTYELLGKEFEAREPMKVKLITGKNASLIRPRIEKLKYEQTERTKGKAEVFTPTWIVKKQNDIIDQEFQNLELKEYVTKVWLEIACGEAPYMVSRYDSVTGEFIPIQKRVGFIDKKLNRISEEIDDEIKWGNYAKLVYQTSFGYEFQGDSLLIARENVLYTFLDYYVDKFKKQPDIELQKEIAKIISYNIFQMDGLNYTIPHSGEQNFGNGIKQLDLFGELKLEKEDNLDNQEVNILTKIKYWKNKKMVEFQEFGREEKLMKFDVVIGNPPFNDNGGKNQDGSKNRDEPIYHVFLNESYKLADKAVFISPARFLFNAGQTPKSWNEKMLNDPHLKILFYEKDSEKVFVNTDIKGGVVITYRDRYVNFGSIKSFTTEIQLNSIMKKVMELEQFISLSNITYPKSSYKYTKEMHKNNPNISSLLSTGEQYSISTTAFDKLQNLFLSEKSDNFNEYIGILGRENKVRKTKWIRKEYVSGPANLGFFKVAIPASNGTGDFGEVLSSPVILKPNEGHTQTFMTFGKIEILEEANALLKYFKTKFLRCLLGILKVTQHNPKKVWKYVPIQDFTSNSDINWTKSISEIDQQLYKKYDFNEEEINFIETKVKEME